MDLVVGIDMLDLLWIFVVACDGGCLLKLSMMIGVGGRESPWLQGFFVGFRSLHNHCAFIVFDIGVFLMSATNAIAFLHSYCTPCCHAFLD